MPTDLLTAAEHAALEATAAAWNAVVAAIGTGPDTTELCRHFHAVQNAVMANAAARAYPGKYRLAGGPADAG